MKRIVYALLAMASCLNAMALDIAAGTYYFDNSLTKYDQVKLVYGSDSRSETYVVSMMLDEGSRWKVTIDADAKDMYRYTFAGTTLPDGKMNDTFTNVKNNISNTRGEYRTATTDVAMVVGGIYTPANGDNWAQGMWKLLSSKDGCSGTLPILYVNTENGAAITSKDDYVVGSYYLDNLGIDGYKSIGTKDAPLPLQIKGRGNYTWTAFDKKPYRLKLDAKAALMGMNKSKHFVLLAHADDNLAFLRNTVGFEVSRRMGLNYTPAQEPVELVLNGEYMGLYFLTENLKVAKDRVNITEQLDEATDDVTGGWLVEIDNYEDPCQIQITEGNGEPLWITYHSPEVLSAQQKSFLTYQMASINAAIYNTDKTSTRWEQYVDLDTLARYYIVQEVMDDGESFHGSCYMHRDRGDDKKWVFGPVWDFGNAFRRGTDKFIYVDSPFGQSWIGEIAKYPRFTARVKELWKEFKGDNFDSLDDFIDDFESKISTAALYDAERWPNYGTKKVTECRDYFKSVLHQKAAWLVSQWGEGVSGIAGASADASVAVIARDGAVEVASPDGLAKVDVYDMAGRRVAYAEPNVCECRLDCPAGLYVVKVTVADGSSCVRKTAVR